MTLKADGVFTQLHTFFTTKTWHILVIVNMFWFFPPYFFSLISYNLAQKKTPLFTILCLQSESSNPFIPFVFRSNTPIFPNNTVYRKTRHRSFFKLHYIYFMHFFSSISFVLFRKLKARPKNTWWTSEGFVRVELLRLWILTALPILVVPSAV